MSGMVPYVDSQSALDELFPEGERYYWKSHFLDELTDEHLDHGRARRKSPDPRVGHLHTDTGRRHRTPPGDGSAFAHRSASFNASIDASWSDPALDTVAIG